MTADPPHPEDPDRPRRLVAGSVGPERAAPRPDPDEPRWFEPLHVRDADAARDRIASMVAAGADVVAAPAWLTHRRALLPIGETRRAGAWTADAVRVTREAVEMGLERRAAADAETTDDEPREPPPVRLPILVAGPVPALDAALEPEGGRQPSRDAGAERDLRAHAGLLADAGVDLLLVEGTADVASARAAVSAAAETGLPVWAVASLTGRQATLASGEPVGAWAEAVVQAGAAAILVDPGDEGVIEPALARLREAGATSPGVVPRFSAASDAQRLEEAAARWLEAGASALGALDGSTPGRLEALRAALDRVERARLAVATQVRDRWTAWLRRAAARAPGGRALWIGETDPSAALPPGFDWTTVAHEAVRTLPAGFARLVVRPEAAPGLPDLGAVLDDGGILLARAQGPDALSGSGLRLLDLEPEGQGVVLLARREP